jgi:hypothetical protein
MLGFTRAPEEKARQKVRVCWEPPVLQSMVCFLGNWGLNGTNYNIFFSPIVFHPMKIHQIYWGVPCEQAILHPNPMCFNSVSQRRSVWRTMPPSKRPVIWGKCLGFHREKIGDFSRNWGWGYLWLIYPHLGISVANVWNGDISAKEWEYLWLMFGCNIFHHRDLDVWHHSAASWGCPSTAVWG